jgi:hypothetical protein
MKVQDPKKRRRLADQVARGELTLIKLRDKIEGRRIRQPRPAEAGTPTSEAVGEEPTAAVEEPVARPRRPLGEDALVDAKHSLADALDDLVEVLRSPEAVASIQDVDRQNLAKYLTIAKLRLENAIALVRSGNVMD